MKIGSLFSGVAGLELGIEMEVPDARVIWQAECDPHARAVLERWYPGVRRYNDVREIDAEAERPDIICGGFPCQDISAAGKGAGIEGARSGLWSEFARIIRLLRPSLVFIENVPPLVVRGLDRVLADLAEVGLDAEWTTVRAADVGAPHKRERIFILGYTVVGLADGHRPGCEGIAERVLAGRRSVAPRRSDLVGVGQADPNGERVRQLAERNQWRGRGEREAECGDAKPMDDRAALAYTMREPAGPDGPIPGSVGAEIRGDGRPRGEPSRHGRRVGQADADGGGREVVGLAQPGGQLGAPGRLTDRRRYDWNEHRFPPGPNAIAGWDGAQPAVRRGSSGSPGRLRRGDALRLLGNSCVPQQAGLAFRTLTARAVETIARERAA